MRWYLAKGPLNNTNCPKRTELYPVDASPLALSVRLSQARVSN